MLQWPGFLLQIVLVVVEERGSLGLQSGSVLSAALASTGAGQLRRKKALLGRAIAAEGHALLRAAAIILKVKVDRVASLRRVEVDGRDARIECQDSARNSPST